ncbi:MAG: extracellular solute-binding protein, partial [Ruminococcus sp.]|nr:extracellular solute-binding protein [Ruminococcus sp.]
MGPEALAANTTEDGKIYSITAAVQAVGYFYNTEMFERAGITPAETWDEFWSNCDKLLDIGVYPLCLMTGENSWTTNLLLANMIGGKGEDGVKLMNTKYPETYQTPEVIAALEDMQVALQKYATPDALGAAYANAANNFLTEQGAIIFNGSWMIDSFANAENANEGLADRVGFALYPGK